MAGHSKWANIKRKKAKVDQKRGKLFSRIIKELIVAVKQGGPDPGQNPRLRTVVQKAKAANIPNENIERNIKKAQQADQSNYDEVIYELYGYGGVGIICEGLTDNKNRTASDLRIATNKRGGSIASPGSVTYQFDLKGLIVVDKEGADSEQLFLDATEHDAEDFEEVEEGYWIITLPDDLARVREALEKAGYVCKEDARIYIPQNIIETSKEDQENNRALIDWLEGMEDIDNVYHNTTL